MAFQRLRSLLGAPITAARALVQLAKQMDVLLRMQSEHRGNLEARWETFISSSAEQQAVLQAMLEKLQALNEGFVNQQTILNGKLSALLEAMGDLQTSQRTVLEDKLGALVEGSVNQQAILNDK